MAHHLRKIRQIVQVAAHQRSSIGTMRAKISDYTQHRLGCISMSSGVSPAK
jgi:hypothetical protein